jgi:hypothetical protein
MYLEEIGWSGVDWIDLAQYRGKWRALVKVTNSGFQKIQGALRVAAQLVTPRVLITIELDS